ncbi:Hypothetical protein I595_1427 [Croceitalea dokdonensis DOKDO 023]|uniref:Lipoprotein n=1 Tax=Croceitalea dokdonensis DOKDO 023 TaxID=1300341 RepID=A0A0P7B3E0_9FLAO|nr:hypothetical protein [Croceitalea dokdonensis]KPM33000.1 Hypothetical protein I595_1427 [Croceitalea dokdonensis DOKDO 023]
MKKVIIPICLSFIILFGISCTEEKQESLEEVAELSFMEFTIPKEYIYTPESSSKGTAELEVETVKLTFTDENGNEIIGYARFTMPSNSDEQLVKAEFTVNIMNDLQLNSDFWETTMSANIGLANKSSCVASCHDEFTDDEGNKIKGRGWCKAQCWAAAVAVVVAAIIAA